MDKELFVMVADEQYKVFLQKGFFNNDSKLTDFFHKHHYCEIHIIAKGEATLVVNENEYKISAGDVILIPEDTMHCFKNIIEKTENISFQIMISDTYVKIVKIPEMFLVDLVNEIKRVKENENYSKVQAFLCLLCTYLLDEKKLKAQRISDYEFIIREYFNINYNKEIKLSDLAKMLHLSERQTERMVIKYTGNTFKKEIIRKKMDVASHMVLDGKISLKEISEYVGYQSYSGFWKKYKKYSNEKTICKS